MDCLTLYHGTTRDKLASIKARGLVPCASHGADYIVGGAQRFGYRSAAVYADEQRNVASDFAKMLAAYTGAEPCVIEFRVPRDKAVPDEKATPEDGYKAWKIFDVVPPSAILNVQEPIAFTGHGVGIANGLTSMRLDHV